MAQDYKKTAEDLRKHDNLIKFSLFATAGLAVLTRKPGIIAGLTSAYLTGSRKQPYQLHQDTLDANTNLLGQRPADPYSGFFGDSAVISEVGETAQDQFKQAQKLYQDIGAQEKVEQVIKYFRK